MKSGTIAQTLRPIKLAFLVNLAEKEEILKVVGLNSYLWGGPFNPIIPVFKRTPRSWSTKFLKTPQAHDILTGYLDNYDPDYVVTVGSVSKQDIRIQNRTVIAFDEIVETISEDGTVNYGLSLFELLNFFIGTELRFIRREPISFLFPEFDESDPFLASIFGVLPKKLQGYFQTHFESILKPVRKPCSISDYAEFLAPGHWFFRRLASLYIRTESGQTMGKEDCLFILDKNSLIDVIDYWNLRAIGWKVIPVAKQSLGTSITQQLCTDFIKESYYPYRGNPQIHHMASIMKGRSIVETEFDQLTKGLMSNIPPSASRPTVLLCHHYPRIWDEWARDKDGVECCDLEADTKNSDVIDNEGQIKCRTLDPAFIRRFGGSGGLPRFANGIELKFFGEKEPLAETFPEADNRLAKALHTYGGDHWRFSKRGMVYLASHINWSINMAVPKAEDLMVEWFKMQNWPVELSAPGKIAKQMIKQLGGLWHLGTLADAGLIALLELLSDGKHMDQNAIKAQINKIANHSRFRKSPDRILKHLVDIQMIRLGLDIKCDACGLYSWFSVKDADYELQCPKCLEKYPLPAHSTKDIRWSYKAYGSFALPNKAYGVYGTLLTLRFFSRVLDGSTSPLLSAKGILDGKEVEMDLSILYQESRFGNSDVELVFAECKTGGEFQSKDIRRMKYVAERFPGAVLVFSTLKAELTDREKRILRPLVNRGRKYWKTGRPHNPVLILTGCELFAEIAPPYCWKNAGTAAAKYADLHLHEGLNTLCDLTQQIYLGMDSNAAYHEQRRMKRSARLSQKIQASVGTTTNQSPPESPKVG
jgi:hypothetical protein